METVAKAVGLSRSAVSYALRNHPSIPEKTRKRVREAAEKLGYRRNAYVSALMAQLHGKRTAEEPPTLAWIVDEPIHAFLGAIPFYRLAFEGARHRAHWMGYELEIFPHSGSAMSPAKLGKVLKSRGIRGVIVAPVSDKNRKDMNFPFQDFACSTIGYSLKTPALHKVGIDYSQGIRLLWEQLRDEGYKRPGLILSRPYDERTEHLQQATFLAMQSVDSGVEAIPPCILSQEEGLPAAGRWLERYQPDALLCAIPDLAPKLLRDCKQTPTVFMINHDSEFNGRGIVQPTRDVGAVAVDIVLNQIHNGEQGIPALASTTLIPYRWIDFDLSS